MIGLFQELGPCGVDIDGNVYNNPYSWSNVSNMVSFEDQHQGLSASERPCIISNNPKLTLLTHT